MKLSVVVISYNQLAFIKRLTTQLLDQDFLRSDYQIVIVECSSDDGTPDWLMTLDDCRIVPILLDYKCNRSHARNRGIEASTGEIIVMIDGDHTIDREFLSVHWRAHLRGTCAIVGKSNFADHPEYHAISGYLNGGGAEKLAKGTPLPGRYFLTRNCSVPKNVLLQIGLFDESFDRWGGEDLDLGVRIEDAGIPIYGELSALALHHHLRPVSELLENVRLYGRDGVPHLLRKHTRLFRELNLDRLYSNPFDVNRNSRLSRFVMRLVCTGPIYYLCLWLAHSGRRLPLPRALFDYLHFRQYALGLRDSGYLKTLRNSNGAHH